VSIKDASRLIKSSSMSIQARVFDIRTDDSPEARQRLLAALDWQDEATTKFNEAVTASLTAHRRA
jgi:hypothetical protein